MVLVTYHASSRPGGRPSRQRAAEISDEIVVAAIDAFAEHGMDFSMDHVAAAAGISKQAVYRRWSGKAELLVHALDGEVKRLVKEASEAPVGLAEVALKEAAWRIFDTDKVKTNRISVFLQAEALRDPRLQGHLIDWHDALTELLGGQIRRVLADAGKSQEDASVLAAILLDLLSGARGTVAWTEASSGAASVIFDARWTVFLRMLRSADDRPESRS